MKTAADAGQLAEALALAASTIQQKAVRRTPALGFVHLKTKDDNAIAITASSLDSTLSVIVPAEIIAEGELAVPVGALNSLISAFPPSTAVAIEIMGAGAVIF